MSAFGSNYIRLDCNNLSEEQEKQFYECCGIMLDDYGSFEDKLTDKELNNIYAIISVLYGNTTLYYEESEGHSVSDWYAGCEITYNKNSSGKKETKSYDYCYGDTTANGLNAWEILKKEIEMDAKKNKIEIDWCDEESDLYPNYDNEIFSDLCRSILEKHGGLKELSTKTKIVPIKDIKVDQSMVKSIIKNAKNKNYSNLVQLLEQKLDKNGNYPNYVSEFIQEKN